MKIERKVTYKVKIGDGDGEGEGKRGSEKKKRSIMRKNRNSSNEIDTTMILKNIVMK